MNGPCRICGAIGYELSFGGKDICPSCDCGISPGVNKLRQENHSLRQRILELEYRPGVLNAPSTNAEPHEKDWHKHFAREFRKHYEGILSEEAIERAIQWNLEFMSTYISQSSAALNEKEIRDIIYAHFIDNSESRRMWMVNAAKAIVAKVGRP